MKNVDKWLRAWGKWSRINECKGYPKQSTGICGADIKLETLRQLSLSEDMAIEIDNAIKRLSLYNERYLTLIKLRYIHDVQRRYILNNKQSVTSYKQASSKSEEVTVIELLNKLGEINQPTYYNDISSIRGYILGSIESKDTSILFE